MLARENPFASHRLHGLRFRLPGVDWAGLERRWHELGRRAAIVGPEGSGKTTLLEEWRQRLEAAGWRVRLWRLTRERRRPDRARRPAFWTVPAADELILLDGAEQLSWWAWRAWLRRMRPAHGIVVTTHRPGRLPTLLECRTTPALLDELVAELLGGSSPAVRRLNRRWFRRHEGNLRLVLRAWYDLCARRPFPPVVSCPASPAAGQKAVCDRKVA
ncbi:MAG: hypothetical protein D6766_05365 [Verrucomicrobia bacterium]|nr:MAG: hypothetical protein D6766_05365 [Verrucomicrobiota bacterium]